MPRRTRPSAAEVIDLINSDDDAASPPIVSFPPICCCTKEHSVLLPRAVAPRRYVKTAGFLDHIYTGQWPLETPDTGDMVYLYVGGAVPAYGVLDCSPDKLEIDPEDGTRRYRTPFGVRYSPDTDVITLIGVPLAATKCIGSLAVCMPSVDVRLAPPRATFGLRVHALDEQVPIQACRRHVIGATASDLVARVPIRVGTSADVSKITEMTCSDAMRLIGIGNAQLNDEVCNAYINLINNRAQQHRTGTGSGEGGVDRCVVGTFLAASRRGSAIRPYDVVWRAFTGSKTMHSMSMCVVPLHLPGHWVLIAINNVSESVVWYDSMRTYSAAMVALVRKVKHAFTTDYATMHTDTTRDYGDYQDVRITNCPQQDNLLDCGVFMLQFATRLVASGSIESPGQEAIAAEHMPAIRDRMLWELMHGVLID